MYNIPTTILVFYKIDKLLARSRCRSNASCFVERGSVKEKEKYRTLLSIDFQGCATIHEEREIVLPQPGPPHMKEVVLCYLRIQWTGCSKRVKYGFPRIHSQGPV